MVLGFLMCLDRRSQYEEFMDQLRFQTACLL